MSAQHTNAQDASSVTIEESVIAVEQVPCKDIYTTGSWRNNWYIQLGAGVRTPLVETGTKTHHYTAQYNLAVGRWISPYLGFRFSGYYGSMHWLHNPVASARTANLNVDFMWDMCNSISGYNPSRPVSVIPYIGLGGTFVYDYKGNRDANDMGKHNLKSNQWLLPVSAGLQVRFRLSEYVDLFGEARAMFYGDNFNNDVYGRPVDLDLSATGGIIVHFTGSKFQQYNPCDYVSALNQANAQVNDLRAALATTSAALAAAEAQLPCPEVPEVVAVESTSTTIFPTVRFKINSAYVSSEEMVNVYNIAEYLKANPDAQIIVRGYADKDTGTSEYNMDLSQRRANAVADELVNTYGINRSRLTVKYDGSATQPYSTNDWNRIVIFSQD